MIWADMTVEIVIKRGRAGNTPCAEKVLPTGWEAIRAPPGGERVLLCPRPLGISLSLEEGLIYILSNIKKIKMNEENKQAIAPEEKEGKAKTRQEARKLCAP